MLTTTIDFTRTHCVATTTKDGLDDVPATIEILELSEDVSKLDRAMILTDTILASKGNIVHVNDVFVGLQLANFLVQFRQLSKSSKVTITSYGWEAVLSDIAYSVHIHSGSVSIVVL